MQSDPPQGDPRLQKTNPSPTVATAYNDPCLFFLETTLPGEIPLLAVCWARRAHEYRHVGGQQYWALGDVIVVQNQPSKRANRRYPWRFETRREKSIFIMHGPASRTTVKCSYLSSASFKSAPAPEFRWAIQFLDQKTDERLRKTMESRSLNSVSLAKPLLQCAKLDWASIADALTALEPRKPRAPRPRRPSFVGRLVSALTGKSVPA